MDDLPYKYRSEDRWFEFENAEWSLGGSEGQLSARLLGVGCDPKGSITEFSLIDMQLQFQWGMSSTVKVYATISESCFVCHFMEWQSKLSLLYDHTLDAITLSSGAEREAAPNFPHWELRLKRFENQNSYFAVFRFKVQYSKGVWNASQFTESEVAKPLANQRREWWQGIDEERMETDCTDTGFGEFAFFSNQEAIFQMMTQMRAIIRCINN